MRLRAPTDRLEAIWFRLKGHSMTSETSPVWFITGCSTGFGLELAKLVLARGWRPWGPARARARVTDLIAGAEDHALALSLDVTDNAQVTAAVEAAEARFGR